MKKHLKRLDYHGRKIARKIDTEFLVHVFYTLVGASLFLMTLTDYGESPSILNIIGVTIACFVFCYGLISLKRDIKKGGMKAVKKTMSGK